MPAFYRPPADLNDFEMSQEHGPDLRSNWDRFIAEQMATRDQGLFYNAANDPLPGTVAARQPIPWNGFPRSIWQWFNGDSDPAGAARALAAAETLAPFRLVRARDGQVQAFFHRQQDEYCEWHVDRDANGGITRICFTSEGPEYWSEMARIDLDLVTGLYQEFVNSAVQAPELIWEDDMLDPESDNKMVFRKGEYNPYNKWNTTLGAMHLTHPANTLGAEINLAADATVIFPSVSEAPANTLPTRLICCAGFGGVNRSSDPIIGAGVNGFARGGKCVTLDNPVGLYIQEISIAGLRSPTNQPIGSASLRIRRANPDNTAILRAEVRVPDGANYTLDRCRFEGALVSGGGQIAHRITMVLFGLAKVVPGRQGNRQTCRNKCCNRPGSPNFLGPVQPNVVCEQVSTEFWNQFAPTVPATPAIAAVGQAKTVPPPSVAMRWFTKKTRSFSYAD
jgi:hypothetical protein